jgi:hypothetical protein
MIFSTESLFAVVDSDADPNTTESGRDAAVIAVSRVAIVSSASSQLIRSHAGSSAPFAAAGAAPDRRGSRSPAPPCPHARRQAGRVGRVRLQRREAPVDRHRVDAAMTDEFAAAARSYTT